MMYASVRDRTMMRMIEPSLMSYFGRVFIFVHSYQIGVGHMP